MSVDLLSGENLLFVSEMAIFLLCPHIVEGLLIIFFMSIFSYLKSEYRKLKIYITRILLKSFSDDSELSELISQHLVLNSKPEF